MQRELSTLRGSSSDKKNTLLTVILSIIFALVALRLTFNVMYVKVYVIGYSMESTLSGVPDVKYSGGDYVYAFRSHKPRYGDIVVIQTEEKPIIKRVVALGGDWVELREGVLYLNDKVVDEPYVLPQNNTPSENNYEKVKVPKGHMFCLGDNRNVSVDSRSEKYGFIDVNNIIGIVADWSLSYKSALTALNTFFDYTLPQAFGK